MTCFFSARMDEGSVDSSLTELECELSYFFYQPWGS